MPIKAVLVISIIKGYAIHSHGSVNYASERYQQVSRRLIVRCPAKVNTCLAVGPRDHQGYHPIRTIFQAIGLFDTLIIEEGSENRIESDWPDFPQENTLSKVLRLVSELIDVPPLSIRLEKRIPPESGFGGGSSDAAGLIRALTSWYGGPPVDQACEIASAVGKDVTFFLQGGKSLGEGYGEIVTPLPDDEPNWLTIGRPSEGVSTVLAYAALDEKRPSFSSLSHSEPYSNDFELVAPARSLDIKQALLDAGASAALLCGSGSAVFGVFESKEEACRAESSLAGIAQSTWVVPTLSREESLWMS